MLSFSSLMSVKGSNKGDIIEIKEGHKLVSTHFQDRLFLEGISTFPKLIHNFQEFSDYSWCVDIPRHTWSFLSSSLCEFSKRCPPRTMV